MPGQKFDLTWQTFSSHAREIFRELLASNQFADVTLVCDDLTKIQAHRIVLSACSSVFREILQGHTEGHPIIYLRGVQHREMESLLQFMYNAEASFSEDRVNEFLKVAKDLDIKEIAENVDLTDESSAAAHNGQETDIAAERLNNENRNETRNVTNNPIKTGKTYQCEECDAECTTSFSLHQHRRSVHEGVQFSCHRCDYKAAQKINLKTHIESVHDGLKATSTNLKRHDGIRYPCDQCDYKATLVNSLKGHIESVHDGIKYSCNQCEYKATQKPDLKRHIKFQHRAL